MEVLEKTKTCRRVNYFLIVVLIGLTSLLVFSIIVLSCVPPVSKDALVHHLAVPKLYLKHGGIHEIRSMVFSYYPMNLDMLYLIPLYFGNDIVPKFIHFSFALLTAWLIFYYLRRRTDANYALGGALFFLSIPIVVKLSITVYVDLGLMFFTLAALLLLFRWVESGFKSKFLLLSAVFCGLAMGTKYHGLITFFLLTLFIPFIYSRYGTDRASSFFHTAGQGLLFFLLALLVFSPWMIRNYMWTHNPVYPLYNNWFSSQETVLNITANPFLFRSQVYNENWWQIALLPVRIFLQGQDGNPQYFDGRLNPFLLIFPCFAFYRIREDSDHIKVEKKILLAFVILSFAFVFFSVHLRIRYFSAILPPLVLLSVYGLRNLFDLVRDVNSSLWRRAGLILTFGLTSFLLWLNAAYVDAQYKEVGPLAYLSRSVSRDEYIDRYRYEYPAMRYINENLPKDARILFVYLGNRGYYCDREYMFDMKFNRSTLLELVKNSDTPEQLLLGLKGLGISHLLIRYDIFEPWVQSNFDYKDKQLLRAFSEKYMKLLFFKWGYGLSSLEDFSS
jgi:hypothetical protein